LCVLLLNELNCTRHSCVLRRTEQFLNGLVSCDKWATTGYTSQELHVCCNFLPQFFRSLIVLWWCR
jgi:hypothetical protein